MNEVTIFGENSVKHGIDIFVKKKPLPEIKF